MDPVKLANLQTIVNLPGFAVILEIFESQVQKLERAVFETDPADNERVVAAHRVAVGARWTLIEAQREIRILMTRPAEEKPQTREQEDDLYLKSLL